MMFAYSQATRDAIAASDSTAMCRALAGLATSWACQALGEPLVSNGLLLLNPSQCMALPDAKAAQLAAALDLVKLLELSPEGRQALARFGHKKLLHECEGE
jgi:hypothetical protein